MKKFAFLFISVLTSATVLFAGCFNVKQTPSATPPIAPDNLSVTSSMTLDEFMEDGDTAINFVNGYVRDKVIGNQATKSETWSFKANSDGELTSMQALYTINKGGNIRSIEHSSIDLVNPIDLDDIAANKVSNVELSVTSESAFAFDAKLNYDNSALRDTLASVFVNNPDTCNVNVYDKIDNGKYVVAYQDGNELNVKSVSVNSNLSDSEAINAINNERYATSTLDTYTLSDAYLNVKGYTLESGLKDENENPGHEGEQGGGNENEGGDHKEETQIGSIEELATTYSAEMNEALNGAFKDKIYAKSFKNIKGFSEDKIVSSTWDVGNSDEISEIKLLTIYQSNENECLVNVGKVTLKQSINIENLTKENLNEIFANADTTASSVYDFSYNPSIQTEKSGIMNKILSTLGNKENNAEYVIKDNSSSTDDELKSMVKEYIILKITSNEIQEFSIKIKGVTDEECITNLSNSSNYKVYNEKSCTLDGLKISNSQTNTTYAIAFDEDIYAL